jgi:glutamine cyclotransferase
VQLLWHGGKGLVRDAKTFKVQQQFELPEGCDQGWGLTHDGGEQLFLSDGAAAC